MEGNYNGLLVIDTTNIILNSLMVCSLKKLKKTSIISYWLIFCMSISDALVGIFGMTSHATFIYLQTHPEENNERVVTFIIWTNYLFIYFFQVSGGITTVIAIDRFIRMRYLNRYNNIMTWRKAYILIAIPSIFYLGTAYIIVFQSHQGREDFGKVIELILYILYLAGYFFIALMYVLMYVSVRRKVETSQISNPLRLKTTPECTQSTSNNETKENAANTAFQDKITPHDSVKIVVAVEFPMQSSAQTCLEAFMSMTHSHVEQAMASENANNGILLKKDENITNKGNLQASSAATCLDDPQPILQPNSKNDNNGKGLRKKEEIKQVKRLNAERELFKYCFVIIFLLSVTWLPTNICNIYQNI